MRYRSTDAPRDPCRFTYTNSRVVTIWIHALVPFISIITDHPKMAVYSSAVQTLGHVLVNSGVHSGYIQV